MIGARAARLIARVIAAKAGLRPVHNHLGKDVGKIVLDHSVK